MAGNDVLMSGGRDTACDCGSVRARHCGLEARLLLLPRLGDGLGYTLVVGWFGKEVNHSPLLDEMYRFYGAVLEIGDLYWKN